MGALEHLAGTAQGRGGSGVHHAVDHVLRMLLVRWRCWRPWLHRHRLWLVLYGLWLVHYFATGVRRVMLHWGRGGNRGSNRILYEQHKRLKRIIGQCPSLNSVYWPTFYAHTANQQFLLLGLKEFRARFLERNPYKREVLALPDGGHLALDWITPWDMGQTTDDNGGCCAGPPVCVLLHGAIQDSASVTMKDLAKSLAKRGMPVVVMNRRGYGGLELAEGDGRLTLFGFDEDLDEVVKSAGRRFPDRTVAIIGFSCGSGFAGRYTGARANISAWDRARGPTVGTRNLGPGMLCCVGYDPGYDVAPDGAVARIGFPYSLALNFSLKYCYAFRHREQLRKRSPSSSALVERMCRIGGGLTETYRNARRLSGAGDSSAWLDMQQPKLDEIRVPSLMINSRDDPICVWANVEQFKNDITANPNLALVELRRGSHGCKFDFLGISSVTDDMIGEFVWASWQEWLCEKRGAKA
mmetsp:Transcript_26936/g.52827  ORF Transcript_26936/g.52827 Transcript_26936/m.52827 type:complete len:467 (-) Transcript_26936:74-1474(-)